VDIHHAPGAVGGDDDETVMLSWFMFADRVLANCSAEDWRPVTMANQVGLFFRAAFVNPFKPIVDCDDRPMGPDGFKEGSVGDLLNPGVDRRYDRKGDGFIFCCFSFRKLLLKINLSPFPSEHDNYPDIWWG
jgi:hypothetical protein